MNLDVLIPSLLLSAPAHQLLPPPNVPALECLLSRADRQTAAFPSASSWLIERWGGKAPYSLASLFAEYDRLDGATDAWLFAEPVHLQPDRDRVKLFPGRFLELQVDETSALIAALNQHFADRHLQFFAPTAGRWYVRCAHSEIPDTTAPDAARMGSLADFQPRSIGRIDWRSLQNEAQMLFFSHPVNQAREAVGKSTVSGIWIWGGGGGSQLTKPAYDRVFADTPLAMQLARKTGIALMALPWLFTGPAGSAGENVLLVDESCAEVAALVDLIAWQREVERLDRELFGPLLKAISSGAIQRLNIHIPNDEQTLSFHITRLNQLLKIWRAVKPLLTYA